MVNSNASSASSLEDNIDVRLVSPHPDVVGVVDAEYEALIIESSNHPCQDDITCYCKRAAVSKRISLLVSTRL